MGNQALFSCLNLAEASNAQSGLLVAVLVAVVSPFAVGKAAAARPCAADLAVVVSPFAAGKVVVCLLAAEHLPSAAERAVV